MKYVIGKTYGVEPKDMTNQTLFIEAQCFFNHLLNLNQREILKYPQSKKGSTFRLIPLNIAFQM